MFRFHKGLDVITLFHKKSLPASMKVQALLKQISAKATEQANSDVKSNVQQPFELNMTEDPPTPDQLKNILEYAGPQKASTIVTGARDEPDALKKLRENPDSFQRPITVDWNNGKVVAGDNESEILKMLESLPKQ